jgi:hypothetical protein
MEVELTKVEIALLREGLGCLVNEGLEDDCRDAEGRLIPEEVFWNLCERLAEVAESGSSHSLDI